MAYIYKITNQLNGKCYVGKTMLTIQERWKQHLKDAKRERCNNRPLYKAINKYGENNFKIEQLEKCSDNIVNEREQYWIEKLNSFHFGYNATTGGDGTHYLDYDKIVQVYLEGNSMVDTAKICNCSPDSVKYILLERNIDIRSSTYYAREKYGTKINQYDLNNNYIQTFPSYKSIAQYFIDNGYSKAKEPRGILRGIQNAVKSNKAYKGFIWKIEKNN